MKACRSLLYVPGDRRDIFHKAAHSGADAIVIDLEDSVAPGRKDEARSNIQDWLGTERPNCDVYIRINASSAPRDMFYADLEFAVAVKLEGIFVPKVDSAAEIRHIDSVLQYLEYREGLALGHVRLGVIMETVKAIADARSILEASPRIAAMGAGGGRDGDTARSVGYRWTPDGDETWYLRSKLLLDARAAGILHPLYSGWMEVRDVEGLRRDAIRTRNLGYAGQMVIHPSHVPVCNEVYGPSAEELAYYRRVVDAFTHAERENRGVIEVDGRLVDKAMAVTAAQILNRVGENAS
jgi:citrate lyase subunit beta / citryl-CoA lyase